ncbi:hypothetical protein D3C84_817510 [compost metagenome]
MDVHDDVWIELIESSQTRHQPALGKCAGGGELNSIAVFRSADYREGMRDLIKAITQERVNRPPYRSKLHVPPRPFKQLVPDARFELTNLMAHSGNGYTKLSCRSSEALVPGRGFKCSYRIEGG